MFQNTVIGISPYSVSLSDKVKFVGRKVLAMAGAYSHSTTEIVVVNDESIEMYNQAYIAESTSLADSLKPFLQDYNAIDRFKFGPRARLGEANFSAIIEFPVFIATFVVFYFHSLD